MNNYHPLFVHFPIALLTLYSLIELVPDKHLAKIKGATIALFLLATGLFSSWPAFGSGDAAQDLKRDLQPLIQKHELFASISIWLYGIALLAYVLNTSYVQEKIKILLKQPTLSEILKKAGNLLYLKSIRILIALSALIAMSITGALGGAITHGPNVDFIVSFVYNLFF